MAAGAAITPQLKRLEPLIAAWDDASSNWGFYEPAEFPGSLPLRHPASSCREAAAIALSTALRLLSLPSPPPLSSQCLAALLFLWWGMYAEVTLS